MAQAMELEAFLDEQTPLLQAAAAAAAESLVRQSSLNNSALSEAVQEALLKENADAGDAAAARCKVLRSAFAKEICSALELIPETCELTAGWEFGEPSPPVRVELRGTAGRTMHTSAFAVGRAAECDVQAVGDETVLPVQCMVVSLPGAILVADFWSEGGTHMTWHTGAGESASPVPAAAKPAAFVVEHGERTVLRIGARTTITLGPKAPRARKGSEVTAKRKAAVTAQIEAAEAAARAKAPRLQSASTSFGSLFSDSASDGSSGERPAGGARYGRSASEHVRAAVGGC